MWLIKWVSLVKANLSCECDLGRIILYNPPLELPVSKYEEITMPMTFDEINNLLDKYRALEWAAVNANEVGITFPRHSMTIRCLDNQEYTGYFETRSYSPSKRTGVFKMRITPKGSESPYFDYLNISYISPVDPELLDKARRINQRVAEKRVAEKRVAEKREAEIQKTKEEKTIKPAQRVNMPVMPPILNPTLDQINTVLDHHFKLRSASYFAEKIGKAFLRREITFVSSGNEHTGYLECANIGRDEGKFGIAKHPKERSELQYFDFKDITAISPVDPLELAQAREIIELVKDMKKKQSVQFPVRFKMMKDECGQDLFSLLEIDTKGYTPTV